MSTTDSKAARSAYMGMLGIYMTGAAMAFGIWLGDELGLYRALAGAGPLSSDEVAARASCHPRLVREWLDGQAAGGLVAWDSATDRYELAEVGVAALADDRSHSFVARGMSSFAAMWLDRERLVDAFRGDGKIAWGDHHECLYQGTEWMFRTGYRAALPGWIESLDGVADRLRAGGSVADVGCGHGASVVVMAEAFPAATFRGFDLHAPSIEVATARAADAGVGDRATFAVADAKGYDGTYDLICFFDCLHDMGDPVGIAAYAREHLRDDGIVLLVEPFALADRGANLSGANPAAALMYTASTAVCTPSSLSQEGARALGAQAGEDVLREVMAEAGFTRFRTTATTSVNLILEARP
jgi:2-polyprenyl-3-methyl-5-hydroxy-6-metoxy-1,4-benzoquinol methylase